MRTKRTIRVFGCAVLAGLSLCLISCGGDDSNGGTGQENGLEETPPEVTNRIDIPAAVRRNLGITFANVERRAVERTLRIPGRFELTSDARRTGRVVVGGRVSLHVELLQEVAKGDLLATIESPEWMKMRHEAVEAEGNVRLAEAALTVAEARMTEQRASIGFVENRIASLGTTRRVELEAELAVLQNALPRLEAEHAARVVDSEEAEQHFSSAIQMLASFSDRSLQELMTEASDEGPLWKHLDRLDVRAGVGGRVDAIEVTDGEWVAAGEPVVTVVDPSRLRFRALAPQADLRALATGQPGEVVLPEAGTTGLRVTGAIQVGYEGHPVERTVPVYLTPKEAPDWARAGMTGFLEVVVDGSGGVQLAIPLASVVRDELDRIFFRRLPNSQDQVVPVVGDFGADDGRWIVVNSGVKAGDEIVLQGAYSLNLAGGSRQAPDGYHFHADGSLHKNH